ncbi:MAG: hypothetical protein FWD53_04945, partial [Phycisphaerales bacterium]|nr:hypothetical protein [Phycisphaerales bacterium]
MIPSVHPSNDAIIVPRRHGQILIEPGYDALMKLFRRHACMPLDARKHFLTAAKQWAKTIGAEPPPDDALNKKWIITGHQVEFYHAGVWAKVIASDELAKRSDGVAFDLLVDHDVVDHLGFDMPVCEWQWEPRDGNPGLLPAGEKWRRLMVAWGSGGTTADSIAAPNTQQFKQWSSQILSHSLGLGRD